MASLSPEQQRVLGRIRRIGRRRGASTKEIKAAIETGLVESNLRNLPGGDADSAGWRQERASLYADPTNLGASIRRFYKETGAVRGKYSTAGALAAAVQRPAAQYRGRYQQQSKLAQQLLGGGGGGGSSTTTRTTTTTPGVDNRRARAALVQSFLEDKGADPVDFALRARGLRDVAPTSRTRATTATSGGGGGGGGVKGSQIKELFWQGPGGVNLKDGKPVPQGFVSGHTDHVHVAAGPKTVVRLGKLAQQMGLHVGENPHFGGVTPVHAQDSYHYRNEAIDVSGDPTLERKFAHRVARYQRRKRRR